MTLLDLCVWLGIAFVGFQFWRIRSISEKTGQYLNTYCQQNGLQLISVARKSSWFSFKSGKLDWLSTYEFEFSSNGENAYKGKVTLIGLKVLETELPPYQI